MQIEVKKIEENWLTGLESEIKIQFLPIAEDDGED